ncbi:MAG: protein jag [Termitinemataceae bacterium]|nr:MAG: protein jag [Termitinemataceae bacterium]
MIYEFEGRTEKEAIDNAAKELNLTRDSFDVEIVEVQKGGIFKKGLVKIQVHTDSCNTDKGEIEERGRNGFMHRNNRERKSETKKVENLIPQNELEKVLIEYLEKIISLMGYEAKVGVQFREDRKLGLQIDCEASAMVIGKKGKTLDALQLLLTIRAGRLGKADLRIILDCENYRFYREESLVRLAYSAAEKVRSTRRSLLLEPMNPFDRRLVHTTLNDMPDINTKSEGEGMYKQIRVFFRLK